MVQDPVCGMRLETGQVAATYTYLGRTYAFCCVECCKFFARDVMTYVILLAHEPGESMGHRCSLRREALTGQEGDEDAPRRNYGQLQG